MALPHPLRLDPRPRGALTVEGYTVPFERDGRTARGILCGRTAAGERAWAQTCPDPDLLEAMMREEWVGRTGRIVGRKGEVNVIEF